MTQVVARVVARSVSQNTMDFWCEIFLEGGALWKRGRVRRLVYTARTDTRARRAGPGAWGPAYAHIHMGYSTFLPYCDPTVAQ